MEPLTHTNSTEKYLIAKAKAHKSPINGSIELLPLCNMNCDMCYVRMNREEMEQKGKLRSAKEWLTIGREMKEAGTLFLLLTGGEPLLYPEFKEVYLGLKELGFIITINTNGTLITEEWADFFAQNKPRRINISLYGSSNQTYEKLCHFPNGFDKVTHAIQLLKAREIDVLLGYTLTPQNAHEMKGIASEAYTLNCPFSVNEYIIPAKRERDCDYSLSARLAPKEVAYYKMQILETTWGSSERIQYMENMISQVESRGNHTFAEEERKITCLAGNCSYTINWQGFMRPCVMASTPSVSVFDVGFADAWKQIHESCSTIRISQKCAACKYKPLCHTCAVSAYLETGDFQGVPEYLCQYSEELYRLMKEYLR